MASDGIRLTDYYSGAAVCSPSRASVMTGRYSPRTGVYKVIQPGDGVGLSPSETTLAGMLKPAGYTTKAVGKWHLGASPQNLPNKRGFDDFFGMLYSNDQDLTLYHNTDVVEPYCNLNTLTQRYTQQAVQFIAQQAAGSNPFFLYMAIPFPHVPLTCSDAFRGSTGMGIYGDVVAELDWSVGQVLQSLKDNNVDNNTLVIFTSDHGPWYQGSPGILRGRKGETFEGGMRVPFIARFPGYIPGGQVSGAVVTGMDILPTLMRMAAAPAPANPLDGTDVWPLLSGARDSIDRDAFFYFDGWELQAARVGRYKLHISRYNTPPWLPNPVGGRFNLPLAHPELYDMVNDPCESTDLSRDKPEIVADIQARIQNVLPTMPVEVQNAYRSAMNTPVAFSWIGAWPVHG
jgi:arylsulfatase A-like enzyme